MADDVTFEYLNTNAGRSFFERICRDETVSSQNIYLGGVGTLGEKRMHRVIKRAIADEEFHEIRVADALAADGIGDGRIGKKTVADVLRGGEIFEVQTGSFRPLKAKLEWLFENTPYEITVVHPICADRSLVWIDPASGEVSQPHKARKQENARSIADSLYFIKDFVTDPARQCRFRLVLLLLDVLEYRNRDGWSRDGKRGSSKYERIPLGLEGVEILRTAEDYARVFLPEGLTEFTAKEYAKRTGIKGLATYSALHFLEELGLISECGKEGRSTMWRT